MNEDEQVIWGQPVSFLDFVLGFLVTPNQRRVELVPKADPLKFYTREKVVPPSQNLGEIRDANKERVNRSLSNYASNNFLLSTSNIRPDLNGRYNPGLGLFAGDLTALTLSMGFDPFNTSNYYKVATLIPKFRNWGLTRLLANELNNEVRVAGELGKNVGSVPKTLFVFPLFKNVTRTVQDNGKIRLSLPSHTDTNPRQFVLEPLGNNKFYVHMRTWDGDHIPANLSNGDKLTLFQALYDELPEGGEILFPKSGPGYYGTRGTVAGLLRLSRDSRFTPGTKGILLYVDKDGTIKTYEGTSFIKKSILEPKTSLRFFERPLSKISLAEKIGLNKHDRTNLNKFLKEALEDLELYVNSGLYRQLPTINMETAEPSWVSRNGNVSALRQLIDDGVPSVGNRGREWLWNRPNGGTYELVSDEKGNFGIGYNSYRMFDISPEFNVRVGEASAGSARNGYSKIFLTAPKNDATYFITETPELELAKKVLMETQSPRIDKNIMKDFWSGVLQSLRPGAYLSGDEGMLPKGAALIRLFKELPIKVYKRDNSGNIIGSGRTTWEDIRNSLMKPEKWKRREDGLSTDSYLALLKQAKRENSPYYLRYSPDGFTTFNSQSIDNKFISNLLEKTKTGAATQQEFLDAFHNWVSPYGGIDAKIVNGEIVIPHPFLYKKKLGGKITE